MVRLFSKLTILFSISALLYSPSAVADWVNWDVVLVNSTSTTGTGTATDSDSGTDIDFSFVRNPNESITGTVTGGTYANRATNGTEFVMHEISNFALRISASITTDLHEDILTVPSGSCPGSDTTYIWDFSAWNRDGVNSNDTSSLLQPVSGLFTWTVATNQGTITNMYNALGSVPAWFTTAINLVTGTCSGGQVTVTGTGDRGGKIFFTASGAFIFNTYGNRVIMGVPASSFSLTDLAGPYLATYARVNNIDNVDTRIKQIVGTFNEAGTVFIGEALSATGSNTPHQTLGRFKLTVDSAANSPSNGMFEGTVYHDSSSGKVLCSYFQADQDIIKCTGQSATANAQPFNFYMAKNKESTGYSCDTGSSAGDCTLSSTNLSITNGDVAHFNGDLTVDGTSGGGISVGGAGVASIAVKGDFILQNGAVVSATTWNNVRADSLQVCATCSFQGNILAGQFHDVTIDAGGNVRADGLGSAGGTGSSTAGAGTGGSTAGTSGGAGGAHAGTGGTGFGDGSGTSASAFGSSSEPVSAGGGGGSGSAADATGGAGGGTLKLFVNGTLTVNGSLEADGDPGGGTTDAGGGGAGGSIWLQTGSFAGSGTISADGGAGGSATTQKDGGGGAGGRISVQVDSAANMTFSGTFSADGGAGSDRAINGADGTFAIDNPNICTGGGTLATTCNVNSKVTLPDEYFINDSGNLVLQSGGSFVQVNSTDYMSIHMSGNVTVQNGGSILTDVNSLAASNVTIDNGGTWTGDITSSTISSRIDIDGNLTGGNLQISAATIDVGSTGAVSANELGEAGGRFTSNNGSGSGGGYHGESSRGGGGASHAASGGGGDAATGSTAGGGGGNSSTYGSVASCNTAGSGGGAGDYADGVSASGGNGGGVIYFLASSSINISGSVEAKGGNGIAGTTNSGGGGSGGSIHLNAGSGSMSGGGTIDVSGGNGGGGTDGGGGASGGYAKLVCGSHGHAITITNNGGSAGPSATAGSAGTTDESSCTCFGPCGMGKT